MTINIEDAEAAVIAKAVERICDKPNNFRYWSSYVMDGLVALVSEGWKLIPPEVQQPDPLLTLQDQYGTMGVIRKLLETVPRDQVHTLLRTAEVQWERKVLSDG